MADEELDIALAEAIAETGHERFRHLVSDANTLPAPHGPLDYRAYIARRGWRQPVDYRPAVPPAVCGGCGAG